MAIIKKIDCFKVLDSRGNDTLKVSIYSECFVGSAIVPRGASKGKYEAFERDINDIVLHFKEETKCLLGLDSLNQKEIDDLLAKIDGSDNFKRLGGNLTLGISLAVARLSATELNIPLFKYLGGINGMVIPIPMFNILNGGMHAKNNLDVQEIMIVPMSCNNFEEAIKMGQVVYKNLKLILIAKGKEVSLGDEGGFAPKVASNEEAIEYVIEAIKQSNYKLGDDFCLALDCAANSFYDEKTKLYLLNGKQLTSKQLIDLYTDWICKYPLISLEDPLAEEDENYNYLYQKLKDEIFIVGDDLFVTNEQRLLNGIDNKLANSILIKPNQVGTLSKTLETVNIAKSHGINTIISHRSGDSEDSFIADLAIALNSNFIKSGSLARSERTSKYNRLLEVSHMYPYIKYGGNDLLSFSQIKLMKKKTKN